MSKASTKPVPLMTKDEAAKYLGVSPGTLAVWRCVGRHGIPYHKIGRCVRYSLPDLDAWLAENRHDGKAVAQ